MDFPNAQETLDKLKKAFHPSSETGEDRDGLTQFQDAYKAFLSQYDTFKDALVAPEAAEKNVKDRSAFEFLNPIFGAVNWVLKKTGEAVAGKRPEEADPVAERILAEAKKASASFGKLTVDDRLKYLAILQKEVAAREFDIALTITADTGKPIDLSRGTYDEKAGKYINGEISKGDDWFNFAQGQAKSQLNQTVNRLNLETTNIPAGAVNVIGAFNYPYALTIGGIVGGLAAGNGVIISATSKAPGWTLPFMEAVKAANEAFSKELTGDKKRHFDACKDTLVQTTMGSNRYISAHADVVHFVGGDDTGKNIAESRAKNGKSKPILELGGTNVVAVMNSAIKDDQSAKNIAQTIYKGFTDATGQRCTAPRILCAQEGDAMEVANFLKKLCDPNDSTSGLKKAKIGNPFESGVQMGPLVDETAYQRMKAAIALAEEIGGIVSNKQLDIRSNDLPRSANEKMGHWVNPIAIDWTGVDLEKLKTLKSDKLGENNKPLFNNKLEEFNAMLSNEVFGPMIHIIHPVKDVHAAVAKANEIDKHKLATAIFSDLDQEKKDYCDGVEATSVMINAAPKDLNPDGMHGHPGQLQIGGNTHFGLYSVGMKSVREASVAVSP